MARLGVGIVGCGAAAQGIHIPALASLPEQFQVRRCCDPDAALAERVAGRVGAAATTRLDELLADRDVDVVLICSPASAHAAQVLAACAAGKRAVLCEKPLCTTLAEADAIIAAERASGVPVVVGTMHRHDLAVRRLEQLWDDLPRRARLVRSTMAVPPNQGLLDLATEPAPPPPAAASPPPDLDEAAKTRALLDMFVFGLFIHHLPLLRPALPAPVRVETLRRLGPLGLLVTLAAGTCEAELFGYLWTFPHIDWSLQLWAPDAHARIDFPPSFLPEQSTTAQLWTQPDSHVQVDGPWETGYRAEWRHVAAVAAGLEAPLTSSAEARADTELGLTITRAAELLR